MKPQKSEYQVHAEEFLSTHKIIFSAKFIANKPYFADDKENRDVYTCTFTRNKTKLSIQFGQSLVNSKPSRHAKAPNAYDVLSCIEKYSPDTFENWCAEFGYDTDSRKAENTWKLCVDQWFQVERFFTSDELEKIREIN
jgi:hypothetical protein